MHRPTSNSISNVDAVDCLIVTNDLEFENEPNDTRRDASSSRREQNSKRSNDNSTHRSTRHSPPSVIRKNYTSPSSRTRRHHHHHHHHNESLSKHQRISSPSQSPPDVSSRHNRKNRSAASTKRPHSQSRSPIQDRRSQVQHSSRSETSNNSQPSTKKRISSQETGDLSLISEDESSKPSEVRANTVKTSEPSSVLNNNQLHSTPSLSALQSNVNESFLDASHTCQEPELSLFVKSMSSTTNQCPSSSIPANPTNDVLLTIELLTKYKLMQNIPCSNSEIESHSKNILLLIEKHIELHKKELANREREIKLRELELDEREKHLNQKLNEQVNVINVNVESVTNTQPIVNEEKIVQSSNTISNGDSKSVLNEESIEKPTLSTVDKPIENVSNQISTEKPTVTRRNHGKSRFSKFSDDTTTFVTQENLAANLYSNDQDTNEISSSAKRTTISKILPPSDSTKARIDHDLKVISSNFCRKVEFQPGNIDETMNTANKEVPHDLRLTLSKKRTKQRTDDENGTDVDQLIEISGQMQTSNEAASTRSNSNKDDKEDSNDYHQQRSVTATESSIDNTIDKRENRHHQQRNNNTNRYHGYPGQNYSSTNISYDRSYSQGSTPQQHHKYRSNQKRYENDNVRSRGFDRKYPKASRTTHRTNY